MRKIMKLIKKAENKFTLSLTQDEWEKLGQENGWITTEAKKKGKAVNPWAVCNKTVRKKEDLEKFEKCVLDVKKKYKIKKD